MAEIVYNAEQNAKEYKELNVKINALKKRIKDLRVEDAKATIDKTSEINTANNELALLEERRTTNRETLRKFVESTKVDTKTQKVADEISSLNEQIDYINKTGNIKPIAAQERKTPGLSPLGESGRAEPGLGQDFGVVAATDEYLQGLIQKRDSLRKTAPTGPTGAAEPTKPTVPTGATGAISGPASALTSAQPKNVIVGIDVAQDFAGDPTQPLDQTKRSVIETGETGLFSIQNNPAFAGGTYLFLGDEKTGSFSRPVEVSRFRADLYKLSPQEVIEYKKSLGYSNPTASKDVKFINDVLAKAQEVSEFNYYNAASGGRDQVGLKNYITDPKRYGATMAGAGGVVVSAEELKAKTETVRLLATELGVTLSDGDVRTLAMQYAKGAIDANTIKYQVARAGEVDYTQGTAAQTFAELQALSRSYGLDVSDAYLQTATKNIITGTQTLDGITSDFKTQAIALYPTMADGIGNGYTPRQIGSPYIKFLSTIRGVDESSINMNDPFMTRAFTSLNDKGQPEQLPYWKFQNIVREEDPSYGFSKDAETRVTSILNAMGKTFGKVSA
jgi:ribosomal protein L29